MQTYLRTLAFAFLMTVLMAGSAGAADSQCSPGPDTDGDCVADEDDNCPWGPNADQKDSDFDAIGDICEGDYDNDGDPDVTDKCWDLPNPNQQDIDGDKVGDLCDIDRDGDGYTNGHETLVGTSPDSWDSDGDNVSDYYDCAKTDPARALGADCDVTKVGNTPPPTITPTPAPTPTPDINDPLADEDDDEVLNGVDNCPTVFNPGQQDVDADGVGDACDNVIGRDVQVFFIKGGGGPGANCALLAGEAVPASGGSFPLTILLVIPSFLMAILRRALLAK